MMDKKYKQNNIGSTRIVKMRDVPEARTNLSVVRAEGASRISTTGSTRPHFSQSKKRLDSPSTSFFVKKTGAGFTLIEALVAISILLTAVAGPLTIASRSLSAVKSARQQLSATYLAQESVEFIRNKRDNNSLSGAPWLDGIDVCVDTNCQVDVPAAAVVTCGGTCPNVWFNENTGLYGHTQTSGWDETEFTRTVLLEQINSNEVRITSTVSWQSGLRTRSVVVEDTLFNWVR